MPEARVYCRGQLEPTSSVGLSAVLQRYPSGRTNSVTLHTAVVVAHYCWGLEKRAIFRFRVTVGTLYIIFLWDHRIENQCYSQAADALTSMFRVCIHACC